MAKISSEYHMQLDVSGRVLFTQIPSVHVLTLYLLHIIKMEVVV